MPEAVGVSSCCLGLPVNHLFVVVYGCSPHDNDSCKLSYLLLRVLGGGSDWMSESVSEAVGVSCGCLGLPLMLWFLSVAPIPSYLLLYVLCASGGRV